MTEQLERDLCDLRSPDANERQAAAVRLGTAAEPSLSTQMCRALWAEPDFFVRETLAWGLMRMGSAALNCVYEGLSPEFAPAVHRQALHVISKIGDPSSAAHVIPFVGASDRDVDLKALWTLGQLVSIDALDLVIGLLGEEDPERRNMITAVLLAYHHGATEPLAVQLASFNPRVRLHAAEVLACLPPDATEAAAEALADTTHVHARDSELVVTCLMALSELPHNEFAADALDHACRSSDYRVRSVAVRLMTGE